MTAREVIRSFREAYPSSLGEDTLVLWISELEGMILSEIVMTHEGGEAGASAPAVITLTSGADGELTAKEPYARVYFDYLRMRCDEAHADSARYSDSSALFASSYADFADSYNRNHMPRTRAAELKTK